MDTTNDAAELKSLKIRVENLNRYLSVFVQQEKLIERLISFLIEAASATENRSSNIVAMVELFEACKSEREFMLKLFEINFNCPMFFAVYQESIYADLQLLPAELRRLQFIVDHLAAIRKLAPVEAPACFKEWPTAIQFARNLLLEEYQYLSINMLVQELKGFEKLPLNLSVAQIAFIIKLFFEVAIFKGQTVANVFRFFASSFNSKRKENISAGNLAKGYYAPDIVTVATIRDLLARMITFIDRKYFPVICLAIEFVNISFAS